MIYKNIVFFTILFMLFFNSSFGNSNGFIESNFCNKWICIEKKIEVEDTSGYKESAGNTQYTYTMKKIPDATLTYQEFNNGDPAAYYFLHDTIDFRFTNIEYISELIKTVLGKSASYDIKQNCKPKAVTVNGKEQIRVEGKAKFVKFQSGFYKMWCGYFVGNDEKTKKLIYEHFYFFLTWSMVRR
jgi:hypothetical protein